MRAIIPIAALVTLVACAGAATGGRGDLPERTTTTVSMPATGAGGSLGSGTMDVTTTRDRSPVVATVALSADALWAALPAAYQAVGIEVGTIDHENRMIGNRRLRVSRRLGGQPLSRYLRCGDTPFGAPQADQYPVELSVLTRVVPDGDRSRMETSVQASAVNAANGGARTACTSTGAIERALADKFTVR